MASEPSPASTSSTPAASGTELGVTVRRRPIPRKGHTKSRRGCFSCKRRKVKCQETLPECSNCTRIGLVCEYPDTARPRGTAPSEPLSLALSAPSAPLQSGATVFTGTDMLFFHHFLVSAYPPLPLLGDDIWRNAASLSHSYDYLMHAMLGLAASHLTIYGGDYSSQALSHRVSALQSLNHALSIPPKSAAEGDARFAAIMALAFQASCMPDGMTEFLSMIKGCHLIASNTLLAFEDSLFYAFSQEGHSQNVRKAIGTGPRALDPDQEVLLQDFLISLRALAPLCTTRLEVQFMAATERVVKLARFSAAQAFADFVTHYSLLNRAPLDEFSAFTEPKNYPAQLLLIHFVLIEFAIGYLALGEIGRRFAFRERACIAWMNHFAARLPEEYKEYARWPMDYVRTQLRW